MASPFLLLHLSDAHIGNPKNTLDSFDVFKTLFADIEERIQHFGRRPDLIVFSGDLVFGEMIGSPIEKQLDQAEDWIRKLYLAVDSDATKTPILMVAGNHDINRNLIGADQKDWISKAASSSGLRDFMHGKTIEWKRFLERQSAWARRAESLLKNGPFQVDENLNAVFGTIEHGKFRIGIAGLNTSWASWDAEKDQGKLWIGEHQLQKIQQTIDDSDFKIVVTHHPVSWLNKEESDLMEQKLQKGFRLHLHGHMHNQWFIRGTGHVRVQAGPCYERSDKPNSYSWITLDFDKLDAHIFLREFTDKGGGGWRALVIPEATDESGCANISELFSGFKQNETNPRSAASNAPPSDRVLRPSVKTSSPIARPPNETPFGDLQTIADYRQALEDRFGFRWEHRSFSPVDANEIIVYWPVRLRPTTAIHMVQTYAAAGLLRLGATVYLCLDDLGNAESNVDVFTRTVQRWVSKADAKNSKLLVQPFSSIMAEKERGRSAWELIREWFTREQYKLNRVLEISKLLPGNTFEEFSKTLSQKPRRLLTPPLVWGGLLYIAEQNKNAHFITLSGYDERDQWAAWHDCTTCNIPVGHLYAPQLNEPSDVNHDQAVHMERTNLAWTSKEDIKHTLRDARGRDGWREQSEPHP